VLLISSAAKQTASRLMIEISNISKMGRFLSGR
jgi:hypothetical protein